METSSNPRPVFQLRKQTEARRLNLNDSEMSVMLLKWAFTNRDLIPAGIEEKPRQDDYSMDRQHAERAKNATLGQVNRHRVGRVDTGRPVIQNLDFVQVRMLRAALRNAGCAVVSAHWFFHQVKGLYFVVVEVAIGGNSRRYDDTQLKATTIEGLRQLSRFKWKYVHIWENRPEATGAQGTYTVNMVGLLPENAHTVNMLAVRDGHLVAIPFVESED